MEINEAWTDTFNDICFNSNLNQPKGTSSFEFTRQSKETEETTSSEFLNGGIPLQNKIGNQNFEINLEEHDRERSWRSS